MSDLEIRIQQIASVLGQLDDTQVPRNIRSSAKDVVDKWLLNKNKDMDIRKLTSDLDKSIEAKN